MSFAEYLHFLRTTLDAAASVSRDGAVHFVCMDWRHIAELMAAAKLVYGDAISIAVWVKSNAGHPELPPVRRWNAPQRIPSGM